MSDQIPDHADPEYYDKIRAQAVESVRAEREFLRQRPDIAKTRREGIERMIEADQELHRKYYPEQYETDDSPLLVRHFWPAWIRKAFKR